MIRTLTIHNIALIEQIKVEFHKGMNVLSGETGAGKSIIIDAVALVLGGRADRDLIRTGCERASVETEFETENTEDLKEVLDREQIEWDGRSVIVYRDLSQSGRNICRINGVPVTAGVLKEVTGLLLNLHGQSEHQILADEERHLTYLDMMGGVEHSTLMAETAEAYHEFIVNHRAYAKLVKMNEGRERRMDILRHELEEFRQIKIIPGEEKRLTEESRHLHRASRIREKLDQALSLIGNGGDGGDAMHQMQTASRELAALGNEDPAFSEMSKKCESLSYEIEEFMYGMNELSGRYEFDASALENVENRLESIRKILKKYGPGEEDVLKNLGSMEEEFKTLGHLEEQLQKTGADHKKLLAAYRAKAKKLTESRREIADDFRQKMMHELKDLGMEHTVIEASFAENTSGKPIMPSAEGDDRVCFMISPNPGEPLKPMSRIASGGELSRLMLALKTIEAGRGGMQTMIFDEIDTGISGRMAQAVAEKMIMISRRQQVICISHLPQIAAAADHHFLIRKYVRDGRTVTEAREITSEERTDEIARMISGAGGITENAKQYARQMLDASGKRKAEI